MKLNRVLKFAVVILLVSSCQNYKKGVIKNLKMEYLVNTLALPVEQPHFSWQMVSDERDLMQTAYSIKVWSDQGTVWNTNKIESDKSLDIQYNGKKLMPFSKYTWQVKAWDNKGNVNISDNVVFETGPMSNKDWQAQWIGMPSKKKDTYDYKLDQAFWIWYPEGRTNADNPTGSRFFKTSFNVENVKDIASTSLVFTGDDTCTMWINGKLACQSKWQKIPHFNVLVFLKEGQNLFEMKVQNKWGGAGVFCQLYLKYKDGKVVYLSSDKNWLASKDKQKWTNAIEFGAFGKTEGLNWLNEYSILSEDIQSPAYLRKEFSVKKEVISARLYATSL
jgi:alpha-L-rhamnosidase